MGSAVVLAAALALTVGAAGTGQAADGPAGADAQAAPGCGAAGAARAASGTSDAAPPAPASTGTAEGTAAPKFSFSLASQAPIGLWSPSLVTLRTPVSKGTVRLETTSVGFDTASLAVQRYEPGNHRWVDVAGDPQSPHLTDFTFPVTAKADAGHPATVALRFRDLDRPGRFTVAASVDDGRGHTYRAPSRTAAATRPAVTVDGWPEGTALARGGAAHSFTVTVKNTTDRAYPALNASYFAYGQGTSHVLLPRDLVLQEHVAGRGWVRVPLIPGGCDPGMSAALPPTARAPLAPGATAVYRLRLAVAASAPKDVTKVDAGVSVGNADSSFFYRMLPFTLRGGE